MPCLAPALSWGLEPGKWAGLGLGGGSRCPCLPGPEQSFAPGRAGSLPYMPWKSPAKGDFAGPEASVGCPTQEEEVSPPNNLSSPDPGANGGAQLPASTPWDFLGSRSKTHLLLSLFHPCSSSRLHQTGRKSSFPPQISALHPTHACPHLGCLTGAIPGCDPCRNLEQRKEGSHLAVPCPAVPPSLPSAEGCCPLVLAASPELGMGPTSRCPASPSPEGNTRSDLLAVLRVIFWKLQSWS